MLDLEAWIPAEKVVEAHRSMQRTLVAEGAPPKTRAQAFNFARFGRDVEKYHGKRLPWRVMSQIWNEFPRLSPSKIGGIFARAS